MFTSLWRKGSIARLMMLFLRLDGGATHSFYVGNRADENRLVDILLHGGVVSERHVRPCGRRPKPTGPGYQSEC